MCKIMYRLKLEDRMNVDGSRMNMGESKLDAYHLIIRYFHGHMYILDFPLMTLTFVTLYRCQSHNCRRYLDLSRPSHRPATVSDRSARCPPTIPPQPPATQHLSSIPIPPDPEPHLPTSLQSSTEEPIHHLHLSPPLLLVVDRRWGELIFALLTAIITRLPVLVFVVMLVVMLVLRSIHLDILWIVATPTHCHLLLPGFSIAPVGVPPSCCLELHIPFSLLPHPFLGGFEPYRLLLLCLRTRFE